MYVSNSNMLINQYKKKYVNMGELGGVKTKM